MWLESDEDKVGRLVKHLFGEETARAALRAGGGVECPYGEEVVMGWVRDALAGTKNNSAAGPDGVGTRLIKVVWDTRLVTEVLGEKVDALRRGYIPDRCRNQPGVLITKPGRDLT